MAALGFEEYLAKAAQVIKALAWALRRTGWREAGVVNNPLTSLRAL